MDRLITSEPSNVVTIRVEPGQKCSGELILRNVMYTMPVAFRLQPMNKTRYSIMPQSGIILPLATLTLEITYQLPQTSVLPHSFPHCEDSFLLQSVVAPGAAVKNQSDNPVPSEWFTNKKKQVYSDSGIKVIFVGSTILTHLVLKGYMDEIREVLEKSDPSWKLVDSMDSEGQTLLHLAISQGRPDLVQLLLEFEPEIESVCRSGLSLLELAAASGEGLIVELLLAHKASPEKSEFSTWGPIHLATANGHIEVLRHLLLKGANVNALTKDGNTALHLAVEERRRDCVRLLLANGARADVRNVSYGDTPLHIASSLGDEQIVKVLLHKGVIKDVRNKDGKTAYDLAAENGHTKLFDALRLGDSLCTAVRKGELRTVLRLLENGASINGRDQNGWTAIHRAAFKGWVDILKAMVEKGIDINAKDFDGYSALHCAVESGQVDVVELLVKRGAELEARTNKGVTALEIAESLQYSGIIRILLHGGIKDGGSRVGSKQKMDLFAGGEMDVGVVKKKGSRGGRAPRSGFNRSAALAVV